MTSCLLRNDYNVIFSFVMLFIFSNFNTENKKYYSKVFIHLLVGLILADCFWFIFISPSKSYKKSINILYLESLNSMHSFCFFLAILEILIKSALLALIAYDYRSFFPNELGFLLTFDYKIQEIPHDNAMMLSNSIFIKIFFSVNFYFFLINI